jgi:carbamate kinase
MGKLVEQRYELVVTHGNGPHVGNILIQNEVARRKVPSQPLDVCVAQSQAQIGYMLQQTLGNQFVKRGIDKKVVSVVTQVLVKKNDKAFQNPTKPIGPYYSNTRSKELMKKYKWKMVLDPRGGFRRIVPSPEPIDIIEKDVIKELIKLREVPVAVGGGGIPVVRSGRKLVGIEAVIDKDLASSLLGRIIGAEILIMITDVEKVALNYGKSDQVDLDGLSAKEARKYLKQGHFPPGTMGPKIEAAVRFLRNGGKRVVITSAGSIEKALKGKGGTVIED